MRKSLEDNGNKILLPLSCNKVVGKKRQPSPPVSHHMETTSLLDDLNDHLRNIEQFCFWQQGKFRNAGCHSEMETLAS